MITNDEMTITGNAMANVTMDEFIAARRGQVESAECVAADGSFESDMGINGGKESKGLGISLTNSICHLDTINTVLDSIEVTLHGVHPREVDPPAPDICISDAGLCSASLELEEHLSNTLIRVEQILTKLQF